MTAGWNRTMMLDATYPVLGMHSGTKYGGVGFDNGTMYWWTNATTTDISAASVAMFLNSSGQLTAGAFIKSGGTSSQFLKADGSIDTNTYLTSATGVSSITGTANQVIASAATGAVTLSLPQNIHTAATPTFAGVYTTGNVGVGDATPASLLTVGSGDLFQVNSSGAIAAAAGITTSGTVTLSTAPTTSAGTYTILTRNSSTGVVESVASTTYAAGSGLSNYVARWTGTNTLSYGLIYDDGSNVGFNTATPQSFVQITRDVTDYADLDTYAQFEITSDEEPSQRLALGHYAGNGFIQALTTGSQYDNLLLNVKGGSVGVGVDTPAATFSVGTGSDSNFRVASTGNVTGSFTQLNGSSTANGSGSNSTTLVVASGTNFDVGNYVRVSSTSCATSVNICYAKITAKSTNTLTISPALTWANASAVVEMNIPEIGGSNTTSTLANRFGRGYFIDGIVTGNGTTFITENGITLSNRDTFEFKKGTSNMFTMDKNASYMDYKFYSHVGNSNLNLSSTSTENQLIVMGAGDTTALAFTGSTSQTTFTLNDEGNNEAFAFSASSSGSSSLSLKYGGSTYLDVYGDGTSGYLSFTNPGGDEFMHIDTDVANRKSWIGRAGTPTDFVFGISNEDPSKLLHVGSSSYTLTDIVARFESSSGTCDVDIASAGWACSSDERLKKNITTLEGTILDQVLALRPVTYNWLKHDEEVDQKYIGFIAQEVEEIFPDLVKTDDESGFKSLNYGGLMPYTIAAIQEMNIQVAAIPKLEDQTLYEKVSTFLRGIAERGEAVADSIRSKKVQTEQLCVGVDSDQVCLTKDQLQQLLNNSGSSGTSYSAPTSSTPTAEAAEPETATSGEAAASETPEETTVISEEETVESAPVEESEPAPESEPVVSAPIE
jgi:hypothetical protein